MKLIRVNALAVAALAAAAILGAGCRPSAPAELRVPDGTPVVLISVDTLRSDRLPAYGYDGVETPAIDALRSDGVLFHRAYTHVPLTLPAHASLLTGLLPPEHGVRDNLGYAVDPATPMLQQRLGEVGYATGAGVSAFVLRRETGIAAGFDVYDDDVGAAPERTGAGVQAVQRPGAETLEAVRPWLRDAAGGPFFLLFHIFEPHTPYAPPPPFDERYPDRPYDGEVAAADAVVGDLLDELRRLGAYDRSLVVFLSDHGEGLGDHGESEHGVFLYRSTLQVPLIVKLPGSTRAGEAVDHPVQLVDVVPTVLDALGLPHEGLPGTPLLAQARPDPVEHPIYAETFYPRLHYGWSDLAAVIAGRHQLIEAPRPELYDLVADPGQTDNLIGAEPGLEQSLRSALDRFDRALSPPTGVEPADRRRLEALGYVGQVATTAAGPLPDPKDRVAVLDEIRDAHRLFAAGELEAAVAAFEAIVAREPGIEDAWEYLALSRIALGRPAEAAETYRRALEAAPGSARLAMNAATLLYRMGRPDEAAPLAELGAGWDPAAAHGLLAQIAVARGDLDTAEREAREALAVAGDRRPGAVLILADVLVARGQVREAVEVLEETAADGRHDETVAARLAGLRLGLGDPAAAEAALAPFELSDDPQVLLLRGQIALARRSWGEARALFERALAADPASAPARLGLGLLAAAEGRTAEARRLLEAALAQLPGSFEGWNALGMVYARQGENQAAIDAWTRARKLRPDADRVLFNLGLAHAQSGRFAEAIRLLDEYAARAEPGPERERAVEIADELRRRGAG
ncbi:MAG TPA: sulfatase-like hydrolase/transferase [Methylomirabilota bacterium]|nr:sulfatase-like hydrolase/transferase [Methylomirabilota bacterium]